MHEGRIALGIAEEEKEDFAFLMGRLVMCVQPEIDEKEAEELIAQFLASSQLDDESVIELGAAIRATMFDPEFDKIQ